MQFFNASNNLQEKFVPLSFDCFAKVALDLALVLAFGAAVTFAPALLLTTLQLLVVVEPHRPRLAPFHQ